MPLTMGKEKHRLRKESIHYSRPDSIELAPLIAESTFVWTFKSKTTILSWNDLAERPSLWLR